jgi:26S proteasome regulatory subunit N4
MLLEISSSSSQLPSSSHHHSPFTYAYAPPSPSTTAAYPTSSPPSLSSDLEYAPPFAYRVERSPSAASYSYPHPHSPSPDYFMPTNPYAPPTRVQQPTTRPGAAPLPHQYAVVNDGRQTQQSWPRSANSNSNSLTRQVGHHRIALAEHPLHKRHSSASSVCSADPASPYTPTTSYPGIIDPENQSYSSNNYDNFEHLSSFQKPLSIGATTTFTDSFLSPQFQDYSAAANDEKYLIAMGEAMSRAKINHREAAMGDGTPTSTMASYEPEDYEAFKIPLDSRNMPKLDRTMSDIYQDELYNPLSASTATEQPPAPKAQSNLLSPRRDVFTECLEAANKERITAAGSHSPAATIASRERVPSPFRQGSQWASEGFSNQQASGLNSASQIRQRQKGKEDAAMLVQHGRATNKMGMDSPKTISPKEAYIDYEEEVAENADLPLFPQENPAKRAGDQKTHFSSIKQESSQDDVEDAPTLQSIDSMATTRRESSSNYSTTSMASNTRPSFSGTPRAGPPVPQQYPFISRRQNSGAKSVNDPVPPFPSTLTSMESTASDNGTKSSQEHSDTSADIQRPINTAADSGTYTCTYHGCTMRFETPSKLQKHKRDGHRQSPTQAASTGNISNAADAAANRNSQAGPHKCERLNPTTGKPCNSIFSRPYDLTRHEDTIHNARKQKVKCQLCTDEKTFSRNDALTRHLRVVHPEVEWPGKSKRKI